MYYLYYKSVPILIYIYILFFLLGNIKSNQNVIQIDKDDQFQEISRVYNIYHIIIFSSFLVIFTYFNDFFFK